MANLEMEAFVCTRAPGLLRRARLLTPDRRLAEDMTQEALTQCVVQWRRVAAADDPDAYLNRVLVNTFMSHTRRRSFTERPTDLAGAETGTPADGTAGLGDHVDVGRALADLTPEQRVVMVMRHFDDRPVADVARELGRSEAWVRQTAHRAAQRLRSNPNLVDDPSETPTRSK